MDRIFGALRLIGLWLGFGPQCRKLRVGRLSFEKILKMAEGLPSSNGCRYYERHKVKVGIICDEFFWDSVRAAADFVYIAPRSDWRSILEDCRLLLVVSTWDGLHDQEWRNAWKRNSPVNLLLRQIIEKAKEHGIKVVFCSKEDPPNYKIFLPIAQICDYVFTSAEEMIPRYRKDCGHDRVFPFAFCINPQFHNPIGSRRHKIPGSVVFSGAWRMKYPRRCSDLAVIFKGVMMSGRELCVIDRNYAQRENWRCRYPALFRPYVHPTVDHGLLQKVHKLFDWAININSVQQSRTMFASRIFELQANGNLLFSNYSLGVAKAFPMVFAVQRDYDVGEILDSFTQDEIVERQASGVRRVMSGETCYERIAGMLRQVGISYQVAERSVLVVVDEVSDRVRESFSSQSWRRKTLMKRAEVTEEEWNAHDIVAFMDDRGYYDPFYLEDQVNAFKYTDCNYITKDSYYDGDTLVPGVEHDFVSWMDDKCRTVFWRASYSMRELLGLKIGAKLPNGYSTDRSGYRVNAMRALRATADVALSVVVSVSSDVWQLYGCAMAALRRNVLFDRMEIILVDVGHKSVISQSMFRHLVSLYPNVKIVCGAAAGAGGWVQSMWRGLEVARGENVAFLTSDFMPTCEGYEVLLTEMNSGRNFDFVIGNLRCVGYETKTVDFNGKIVSAIGTGGSATAKCGDVLARMEHEHLDVRAMLLKKSFLINKKLDMALDEPDSTSAYARKIFGLAKKMETVPFEIACFMKP